MTTVRKVLGLALAGLGGALAQEALYWIDTNEHICNSNKQLRLEIDIPNGNRDSIHVPVFYRTHRDQVTVKWSLEDSDGQQLAGANEVTLNAYSARRLADAVVGGGAVCEDVFLAGGRSPVDLPDTWQEARDAYLGACEDEVAGGEEDACAEEALSAFEGQPSGDTAFAPSAAFCEHLAGRYRDRLGVQALSARRLKGGTSTGGAPIATGYSSPMGLNYGYTSARMGSMYPRGYSTTGYGYSGVGASAPFRSPARVAIVAGAVVGGYGLYRFRSRTGRTNSEDCEDPATSSCEWDTRSEDLIRDDMMNFGFIPSEVAYPLYLVIDSISGNAFRSEDLCNNVDAAGQDLFFSLAAADEMNEGDEDGAFGVLVPIFFIMICLYCIFKSRQNKKKKLKELHGMAEFRQNATPRLGTTPGFTNLTLEGVMRYDGDEEAVKYELTISEDGTVTGARVLPEMPGFFVVGKVVPDDAGSEGNGEAIVLGHLNNNNQPRMFEFRGRIDGSEADKVSITGMFLDSTLEGKYPYNTQRGELELHACPMEQPLLQEQENPVVVPGVVVGAVVVGQPAEQAAKEGRL